MPINTWKYAILPISFEDSTTEHQKTKTFLENMFIKRATGGLVDYWEEVSFGIINTVGSKVFDLKTWPGTVASFISIANTPDILNSKRGKRVKMAMDLYPEVDFRKYKSVIIIPDADVQDEGSTGVDTTFNINNTSFSYHIKAVLGNIKFLGNNVAHANFFAHEMGHTMGQGQHSSGVERGLGVTWESPNEYEDPWDIMGGTNPDANVGMYTFANPPYTVHGIRMHAANLLLNGWLHESKITSFTLPETGRPAGIPDNTIILNPLYETSSMGSVSAIRINFTDINTGTPQSYWVEYRTNTGMDQGAPGNAVLIRKLIGNNSYIICPSYSPYRCNWIVNEAFIDERNNIRISINSIAQDRVAIRVGSFVNQPASLGTIGQKVQAAGIALNAFDNNLARPDLVLFAVENLEGENLGTIRIAPNISLEGIPNPLGLPRIIPNWEHHENQKGDLSMGRINYDDQSDAFILFVDNPLTGNNPSYRLGLNMQGDGFAGWQVGITPIPRRIAGETQGAAVTLTKLDTNNTYEIIATFADLPAFGKPRLFYRVGDDISDTGNIPIWYNWYLIPDFHGYSIAGMGCGVGSFRVVGQKDLLIMVADKTTNSSKIWYIIGRNLNNYGQVTSGWTNWFALPGSYSNIISDISIEVSTIFSDNSGLSSVLLFTAEKTSLASGVQGFIRLIRRLKA